MSKRLRPIHKRFSLAIVASLCLHVVTISALAAWSLNAKTPEAVHLGDVDSEVIELVVYQLEAQPAPVNPPVNEQPVLVMPLRAQFGSRTFAVTPSIEVTIDELMDFEELDEVAADQPPPDAEIVRREPREQTPPEPDAEIAEVNDDSTSRPQPARPLVQTRAESVSRLTPPDFAGNRPHSYPLQARRLGWEGTARLRLFVAADGRVTSVDLVESSGYSILDAAAINTIRTWRGTPATRDGRAVAGSWIVPVVFKLP